MDERFSIRPDDSTDLFGIESFFVKFVISD